MAVRNVFQNASVTTTSEVIQLKNRTNASVHLVTFWLAGDSDGALGKLQLVATTSAGAVKVSDIASTTISAGGAVNVELADGVHIRALLTGMSAAASQSTSVDGFIATGTYIR